MAFSGDGAVSSNQRTFLTEALATGLRLDGRDLLDMRRLKFSFTRSANRATAEVQLGRTRVLAVVTASVVPPFPDRPNEGFLQLAVEFSSGANPTFEAGRPSDAASEITRVLERTLKDARAIDTEALCIMSGSKAWSVRVDVHVLDDAGNLIDAASMATLAALLHFRKADVTITGTQVTVHEYDEKPPVPLSIHHSPVCLTFGLFSVPDTSDDDGDVASAPTMPRAASASALAGEGTRQVLALDPSEAEEDVLEDRLTFAVNAHGELCMVHKVGGAPLDQDDILRYAKVASARGVTLLAHLQSVLAQADAVEKKRAMKAHAAAAGYDDSGRLEGSGQVQASHAAAPDVSSEGGLRIGNGGVLASATGEEGLLELSTAASHLTIAGDSKPSA